MMMNRRSLVAFIFSCCFLLATAFYISKWNVPDGNRLLSWDAAGYYLYLPGFFYDDLGELHTAKYISDTYHPGGGEDLGFYPAPTGKQIIKYSSGLAVMYLPAFGLAHTWAKIGGYAVDGFSYPYQFTLAMYSLLVAFLGLWIARKLLLQHFSDNIAAVVILALPLATNYLNWTAICGTVTHNYLFTLYALIIYQSGKWHRQYDYKNATFIGILCGLAALARPTDIISILIPLLWGINDLQSLRGRFYEFVLHWKKWIVVFLSATAIGFIQLVYWKVYTGKWLYWSYTGDEHINLLKVHFWNCLFSYRKGWFTYTPFMILSVVGFIPLFFKNRKLFFSALFMTFLALWIAFSWSTWWYGGGFTMRAVIQYYAILIFPLAAFVEFAFKRLWRTVLFSAFFLLTISLNLIMHYQANVTGIMETNDMKGTYYWKIFGKFNIDSESRKYIDLDEELPESKLAKLQTIMRRSLCDSAYADHCIDFSGERSYRLTKEDDFIPETRIDISKHRGKWANITIHGFIEQGDYADREPRIYAWVVDSTLTTLMKANQYKLQRLNCYGEWKDFTLEMYIPNDKTAHFLKCGIFNPKGDVKMYASSVSIAVEH